MKEVIEATKGYIFVAIALYASGILVGVLAHSELLMTLLLGLGTLCIMGAILRATERGN